MFSQTLNPVGKGKVLNGQWSNDVHVRLIRLGDAGGWSRHQLALDETVVEIISFAVSVLCEVTDDRKKDGA
ncbi:MAG TPA: hypothetical protein VFQ43_13270 [Nitrososphaera sp.]|nr:hypothetical protein [Nitrososphaera sp.]